MSDDRAVSGSSNPADKHSAIVDNTQRRMGDVLSERIDPGADLAFVSAYFTIYAFAALRGALEAAGKMRFLYGDPVGVGAIDPSGNAAKAFRLTEDGGMELRNALAQKPLARACAAWIRKQVEIRTIAQSNFLHGKLYRIAHADGGSTAIVGSSNFTRRGLGLGAVPNIELNVEISAPEEQEALGRWFDALWRDKKLTRDAKQDVLAALERLGQAYAPEFVYYKTLFHVFEEWLAERGEREGLVQGVALHDSEIWKALYEFQKEGATNAINRLLQHNGCIVADSVGLGKTWTALAVIRFFERRNEKVLVLCPKRLEQNWVRYTSRAAYRNNPFEEDRFGYTVLAHTDLSRYEGKAGDIDLAQFNWGAFDLIVIDESHNFRNEGRDRIDEAGNILRRSRYNRLLEVVVKGGVRTKVLMLSASPVNTSLHDLRNQIHLMTEKRSDAFAEALGIGDLQAMFNTAQREFLSWEEKRRRKGEAAAKEGLLEKLGADFLALLDAVTIARSREHIRRYYPQVEKQIGGFPERAPPKNLSPPTDLKGKLSYDGLHERIGKIGLAIYMPSEYLKDQSQLQEEKEKFHFNQRDREGFLIGMMRVNLLKRLESSACAFTLTLARILKKIVLLEQRIGAWRKSKENESIDFMPDADEEDEEFAVGKKRRYLLDELDVDRWQADIDKDRQVLAELHAQAEGVDAERDAKLAELKRELKRKVETAPKNKDGLPNPKALVFTTFADTARYLYGNIADWAQNELGVHIALVTGGDGNQTTLGASRFDEILGRFSPQAQQREKKDEEIDILIATDCLSEGQNLQDCDLVVNYDIHWNPVRLMQRFGRIDRLGSRNRQVRMVNFWPTADLNRYLDLKNRVEARMALVDATATGLDNPLDGKDDTVERTKKAVQTELQFRDQQLLRLREETLDLEDEGLSLSDFTLDDFIADLLNYIQQNRAALEAAPFGICAVVLEPRQAQLGQPIQPGAIFCLKQKNSPAEQTPNRLQPYFLTYIRDDGTVRYGFRQAKQVLSLFQTLAAGKKEAIATLEAAFDHETAHGEKMEAYEDLLAKALRNIAQGFSHVQQRALGQSRGAVLTRRSQQPNDQSNFELVTWLVILDAGHMQGNRMSADE